MPGSHDGLCEHLVHTCQGFRTVLRSRSSPQDLTFIFLAGDPAALIPQGKFFDTSLQGCTYNWDKRH